jgi:hypothetical protein
MAWQSIDRMMKTQGPPARTELPDTFIQPQRAGGESIWKLFGAEVAFHAKKLDPTRTN